MICYFENILKRIQYLLNVGQLAANHGMDVVLVGRNPDKLRAVAELIRKESGGGLSGRRVTTVIADFAEDPIAMNRGQRCGDRPTTADDDDRPGSERGDDDDVGDRCFCDDDDDRPSGRAGRHRCTRWYPRLRAVVESRSSDGGVGVLINCAGVCYPHPEYFAGMSGRRRRDDGTRTPDEFNADFCDNADTAVRCNVAAVVHACRLVLPGMLARGRGLIVNVGSSAANMPPASPLMALYSATKKFLEKLSVDLDAECAYLTRDRADGSYGVRVQCVQPAYVVTAMLRSANPDVRAVSGDGDTDESGDDGDEDDEYGELSWWAARRKRLEVRVQRWMVPSARRWVRSALRRGGRLYDRGAGAPVSFTGYWPHTFLMWCGRLACALTPRRCFVNHVLIPGMLVYRAKGRSATKEKNKTHVDRPMSGERRTDVVT